MNCLIHIEVNDNWKSFATYFSIKKFFPNIPVNIVCDVKSEEIPAHYFFWIKRLQIPHLFRYDFRKDSIINKLDLALTMPFPLLMIDANIVALNNICNTHFAFENNVLIANNKNDVEKYLDNYVILDELQKTELVSCDAKSENERTFISITKGVGNWINTMVNCPFSKTNLFANGYLTQNERKILKFWSELAPVYEAYN